MKNLVYIIYLFTFLYSQSTQDFILKDVRVEGNIVSSANTIIFTSGLRKGLTVSTAEFPRAIKRLWQLGLFDDVQIRYDDENNNEISVTHLLFLNLQLLEKYYMKEIEKLKRVSLLKNCRLLRAKGLSQICFMKK